MKMLPSVAGQWLSHPLPSSHLPSLPLRAKLSLAPPRLLRIRQSPPLWPRYFWTVDWVRRLMSLASPSFLLTSRWCESSLRLTEVGRLSWGISKASSRVPAWYTWIVLMSSTATIQRPSPQRSCTLCFFSQSCSSSPSTDHVRKLRSLSSELVTNVWPLGAQTQPLAGSAKRSNFFKSEPV